ncbi:MAG: hypothetical protein GY861_27435 [bacterium]|nr:hypothetical protein [bacterium]
MNWVLFIMDLIAVLGFSVAFYHSLRFYKLDRFTSASVSIRSTALFTGVIWCVFLAFSTAFNNILLLEQSAAYLLSFMGGLFAALIIAKMY